MALRHDQIDQWLRQWERMVQEPRHILFSMSFANLVRVTADDLKREVSNSRKSVNAESSGRNAELLNHLEHRFNFSDPEIEVYRREYPQEIQGLKQQLALGKSSGHYSIARIFSLLQRIYTGPTPQILMEELVAGLIADESVPDDEGERLRTVTSLILDHVLAKHSVTHIRDMPKRELARHSIALLLNRTMAKHKKVHPALLNLVDAWRDDLVPPVIAKRHPALSGDGPASMFRMFATLPWRDDTFRFVLSVADVRQIIHDESPLGNGCGLPIDSSKMSDEVAIRVGNSVLHEFVSMYCTQMIEPIIRDLAHNKNRRIRGIGSELGQYMIDQLRLQRRRKVLIPMDHSIVHKIALDALLDASSNVLSAYLAQHVSSLLDSSHVLMAGHELCQIVLLAHRNGCVDSEAVEKMDGMSRVDWISQRSIQDSIWQAIHPVVHQIEDHFRTALVKFRDLKVEEGTEIACDIWDTLIDCFPAWAAANKDIVDYVPWEDFSRRDVERIVAGLFAALIREMDEMLVVFRVSGVDSAGTVWSSANVTFYDPHLLDFGEKEWGEDWTSPHQTTLARVLVRADTEPEAKRAALHHLNEVLNTLSFAASVYVPAGGFHPKIDHNFYYMRSLTTLRGGIGFERRRSELSVEQKATLHSRLVEFANGYHPLLRDASQHPDRLNRLQVQFLRALHWYRRGRWEPDPVEQFLFYWIGLEHLFGNERSLITRLPKLHETWMDLPYLWYLPHTLKQINDFVMEDVELRSSVEANPELLRCLKNRIGLLHPEMMSQLTALVPKQREDIRGYFERFSDELKNLQLNSSDVNEDIERRRVELRFRLYRLYQLRNRLVHEALVYPHLPTIELYVEEIESVFEDILVKMSEQTVNHSPECQSLDDLIEQYEPPWQ